jgi:hypothetical protein
MTEEAVGALTGTGDLNCASKPAGNAVTTANAKKRFLNMQSLIVGERWAQ